MPRLRSTDASKSISPMTTPSDSTSRASSPSTDVSGIEAPSDRVRRGRGRVDAHDLRDADAELLVDDDDLAAGDQCAVDEHVDRTPRGAIELDHRTRREREQVA